MIGIDEVGRGCWAGPLLVVAARPTGKLPDGLKDSKLLTKKQREATYKLLTTNYALSFGEGWVSASEIDELGLAGAMRLGIGLALAELQPQADEKVILDGKVNYLPQTFQGVPLKGRAVVDADAIVPLVSAASIYAKVRRDSYMSKLKESHPDYGFEKHVGYGTAAHRLAIEKHGIIKDLHRLSFKPVQQLSEI